MPQQAHPIYRAFSAAVFGLPLLALAQAGSTVTVTIDPLHTRPISPWIYGANFCHQYSAIVPNLTLNRQGGNRWTAYNWENNASNAGADWFYHNDGYLGGGDTPGEAVRSVIAGDRASGRASLFTVQMQGYVSADKKGDDVTSVNPLATRLATRFKQVVYRKPTGVAFTTTPSTADGSVYMDEFVWAMDQKIPGLYADQATPSFIMLDNEPELWGSTHAEIQSGRVTPADFISKTIALAGAIKNVAPEAKVFGPVHYGFNGLFNWQGSSGFSSSYWFTDRYLTELRNASNTAGRRLVDVYSFNWYSEATDGTTRVTNLTGPALTEAQIQAIVQSPRSLWDPTYTEQSWISQWMTAGPISLLPKIQSKIATNWPGTDIAITEWNNGGQNHIAGAIAIADNLGIFGQQGLFAAAYWPLGTVSSTTYDAAGFKMYRDYDGASGSFGDTCIPAASSDTSKVAVYFSRDSRRPQRHVLVALNRSNAAQTVRFAGLALAGTARLFRLTSASNVPAADGTFQIDLANWILNLPAYSIATVEINATAADTYSVWRAANFSGTDATNDSISGPNADPEGVGLTNFARYAFALSARGPVSSPCTLTLVSAGGHNYLSVSFPTRPGTGQLQYLVEASSDLRAWSTVATMTPAASGEATYEDSVATDAAPRRFLRIRVNSL